MDEFFPISFKTLTGDKRKHLFFWGGAAKVGNCAFCGRGVSRPDRYIYMGL